MCGICGYTGDEIPGLLERMSDAIRHRGPDSRGLFHDGGVHLASQRLRILDIEGGDQPIFNEDRSVAVVYNGEIYNFQELRRELEALGHRFATRTDTEVIVHLYEEHGDDCAARLEGMFTFALYDSRRRRLLLARDQIGIKPLVYARSSGALVFASEAKSVLLHPGISAALDAEALHQLLNIRFVPGPATLFQGISQLPPGHCLVVGDGEVREHRYHSWSFAGGHRALSAKDLLSPEDAAAAFNEVLSRAVRRQLVADVPVGIFLSGGIDSSSIVAGARAAGAEDLRTFCLGFGEPTDELEDAAAVARHLGSRHHASTLSARPLDLYPRIVYHAEAPKVNAAQGYYLSRFARQQATVALSGLGGDELFLGYDLYSYLWPGRLLIDSPLASLFGRAAGVVDGFAGLLDRVAGPGGENPRRMVELLASGGDALRYYLTLRNGWDLRSGAAAKIYTDSWRERLERTTRDAFAPYFDRPDLPFLEQVQWAEFRAKMVDDFLLNEDRMSMANSLEVRVPLLDMEVIRFAFALPLRIKFEGRRLKPVMKRALAGKVPDAILAKKKWGFTFNPYEQFRKDLRGLCERELSRDFIEEQGIFRYDFLRTVLDHRPSPRLRWHYFMIWQILGLKFWQEIFLDGRDWREIEARIGAGATL